MNPTDFDPFAFPRDVDRALRDALLLLAVIAGAAFSLGLALGVTL